MGETCKTATDKVGEASHCYWRDVLGILRGLPWAVLFGAILLVVGRPERTPDRPARGGWLRTAGAAVVVLVVAVAMVGTPIYATAWSAVHQYKIAKEIFETPRPDIARPAAGR